MPGKRRTRPRKSRPHRRPRSGSPPASEYEDGIRKADEILSESNLEPSDDNWRDLVIENFAVHSSERFQLMEYTLDHDKVLGPKWARELLRLDVFLQVNAHEEVIVHYDRALSRYPRCVIVDMWVADHILRYQGDLWRARSMYQYVQERFPEHPKAYYEIGFLNHLLGDLPGALQQFNQAAERVSGYDDELIARLFYNRAAVDYALRSDEADAIADLKMALEHKPDYPQAKKMLRSLRLRRWLPWNN